jgi:mRNA-degrading endonuclease RelE of RelBE toxin-antitoxin system
MDKVDKFLKRLSRQEFIEAEKLIERIVASDLSDLNVKKLKGTSFLFRVRKGDIRVIFQRKEGIVRILEIERRGEQTYRHVTK